MTHFTLNGSTVSVDLPDDTPLLWVVRDHLGLLGTKFGCGVGQCGACTVHVNGTAVRSCTRTLASVSGADIVTIEGLGNGSQHPLQKHWIKAQVPQCGYCQPGSIMQAASLLNKHPDPTDEEIVKTMNTVLCRCMTYDRIKVAIKGAATQRQPGTLLMGELGIALSVLFLGFLMPVGADQFVDYSRRQRSIPLRKRT